MEAGAGMLTWALETPVVHSFPLPTAIIAGVSINSSSKPAFNLHGRPRNEPLSSGLVCQSPYGSSGGFSPPL